MEDSFKLFEFKSVFLIHLLGSLFLSQKGFDDSYDMNFVKSYFSHGRHFENEALPQ